MRPSNEHPRDLFSKLYVPCRYRLAAFGFLSSPGIAASGGHNTAITDAAAALRFVNRHISKFGGDPDQVKFLPASRIFFQADLGIRQVTIWGQSSGGGTVAQIVAAEANRRPSLFR